MLEKLIDKLEEFECEEIKVAVMLLNKEIFLSSIIEMNDNLGNMDDYLLFGHHLCFLPDGFSEEFIVKPKIADCKFDRNICNKCGKTKEYLLDAGMSDCFGLSIGVIPEQCPFILEHVLNMEN